MLRTFTTTSLAAIVAATFSISAIAQQSERERQADQQQSYTLGGNHSDKSIAEVLSSKDKFSKFEQALDHADMKDTLASGEYTVFAPTDEAFERLPDGTWDSWMDASNSDELREILSYHIVETRIGVDEFDEPRSDHATLNGGGELRVSRSLGNFSVNTAAVTHADIQAENGYIHAIDAVLLNSRQRAQQTTAE